MGALERVIGAETSSDLKQKETNCDVDTLRVIALSAIKNPGHLAVFRLKYLGDAESLAGARTQFYHWTCCALSFHAKDVRWAKRVATEALTAWMTGTCDACRGLKYIKLDGAPALSNLRCQTCQGTGRKPIKANFVIIRDVLGKADLIVKRIEEKIHHRLVKK